MAIKITDPKIRVTMINDKVRMYLLPPLFNAAVRAGASIMRVYKNLDDYDISLKDDKTPITLADRVAHKTIREYLGPTRIPILSEEGRKMRYEERRNWELYWLVDPLDGTVEFIKGNNEFTVNIALMENNVCMGAVIYVPYFEKMYIAGRDSGSYLKEHIAPDAAALLALGGLSTPAMGYDLQAMLSGDRTVHCRVYELTEGNIDRATLPRFSPAPKGSGKTVLSEFPKSGAGQAVNRRDVHDNE